MCTKIQLNLLLINVNLYFLIRSPMLLGFPTLILSVVFSICARIINLSLNYHNVIGIKYFKLR